MQVPHILALLPNLGGGEIIFIVVLIIILFGAQKIPELARSLGKAQREFNRAREELESEPASSTSSDEDRLRRAAQDLGINPSGKSVDELRQAIGEKVGGPTYKSP
ncbi:MAG TPA: twin-arginine translocase TatA/TatE family subunit [Candidatus Thermoplasmatota archaeon]|nr:twin-arginine translocase TatA/TatE family subunit [Candidatus Thermoplasmatota archaeon]